MAAARKGRPAIEERIRTELQGIRENVVGVHGSIVATSDGLLVAHDVPDLEPTQIAALVATTFALTSRATAMTGRGQFRETVARGHDGYLAVYAAGESGIVAVIGTSDLNVGMLQYQARGFIERIAAYAAEFGKWTTLSQPRTTATRATHSTRGATQLRPAPEASSGQPVPAAPAKPAAPARTAKHASPAAAARPAAADPAAPTPLPSRRASARP
jgi:uncharacterized protein